MAPLALKLLLQLCRLIFNMSYITTLNSEVLNASESNENLKRMV